MPALRDDMRRLSHSLGVRHYAERGALGTSRRRQADGGSYPFCYSTAPENVISEPAKWREYYERASPGCCYFFPIGQIQSDEKNVVFRIGTRVGAG